MNKTEKTGKTGISVRVLHLAMIVCAVLLALLLVFSTYQSNSVFSRLSGETEKYIVRQKAASDLMSASDYLTEMAQRFTLEGDTAYLDRYFEEAFVSKRREAAIIAMSGQDADRSLIERLQAAMDESMALMYREYYAMKLVIEAQNIQEYPETLRAIELTEEDSFLPAEEKMDLAKQVVMGSEYYASKGIIRSELQNNLTELDRMMSAARQDVSNQMMKDLTTERIAIIALAVILILLVCLTAYLNTLPMLRAAESIRKKEKIHAEGTREFRQLADSYNEMYASLHQHPSEDKTE